MASRFATTSPVMHTKKEVYAAPAIEAFRPYASQEHLHDTATRVTATECMNSTVVLRVKEGSDATVYFHAPTLQRACQMAQLEHPSMRTFLRQTDHVICVAHASAIASYDVVDESIYSNATTSSMAMARSTRSEHSEAFLSELLARECNHAFSHQPLYTPARLVVVSPHVCVFTFDHRIHDGVTGLSILRLVFRHYVTLLRSRNNNTVADGTSIFGNAKNLDVIPCGDIPTVDAVLPHGMMAKLLYSAAVVETFARVVWNGGARRPLPATLGEQRASASAARQPISASSTASQAGTVFRQRQASRLSQGNSVSDMSTRSQQRDVSQSSEASSSSKSRWTKFFRGQVDASMQHATDVVVFSVVPSVLSALEARCKKEGVSVGTMISTAFGCAIATAMEERSVRMWAQFIVDMRKFFMHKEPAFLTQTEVNPFAAQGNCIGTLDSFFAARALPGTGGALQTGPTEVEGKALRSFVQWFWSQSLRTRNSMTRSAKSGGFIRAMMLTRHSQWYLKRVPHLPGPLKMIPTFSLSNVGSIDDKYMLPSVLSGLYAQKGLLNKFDLAEFERDVAPFMRQLDVIPASTAPLPVAHLLVTTLTSTGTMHGSVCFPADVVPRRFVEQIIGCFHDVLRTALQ